MTATATTFFVGERLSLAGWAGIVALAAGVLLLSMRGGRDLARLDRRAVGFALFTALTICTYSVVDGIGARLSGQSASPIRCGCSSASRVVWCLMRCAREGAAVFADVRRFWRRGLIGGGLQVVVLRHRAMGDDAGADRHRRHLARNQRAVRRRASRWSC